MKRRFILAVVLHTAAIFIMQHYYGWALVFGVYIALTANNIEQSGRFYDVLKKLKKED